MNACDLAIIGAGPAGMAAATEAANAGLSVILLDEQPAPGGQIYRGIETVPEERRKLLGPDYGKGLSIAQAFRASNATYIPEATVWNINPDLSIDYSRNGGSSQISTRHLLIATGAVERPTPMPGWTLPGVTTAGALQILLKAHGGVGDDVVLVGSGPLLYLLAQQMIEAGGPPKAIIETIDRSHYLKAARHLPRALSALSYLRKGMAMMRQIRRAGVPHYTGARDIRIEGAQRAEAVCFSAHGRAHRIETTSVALHQGVVPNQQATRLLGCDHVWSESQRCFIPKLDAFFESSVENVFVAGDGAGIAGANSAEIRGRIVALRVAQKLGDDKGTQIRALQKKLSRDEAIRPFLETLYAPSDEVMVPHDDVLVCRCEEVTAGAIREAVDLGAPGPNQIKSFLRSGMGPCQGRMCGLAVSSIIAERRKENPQSIGYYRLRPPLKPLLLSELAQLEREPTRDEPL
ncbi:FAD-dependent oxidoreductase [Nitratireductor sp. B36]|uniref:FAD/NAD(P)-dependent oxidoreductase n=1 Tax=Nitratireductor sp. B36 TaxID=2762059 RepID=UPI001E41BF28|nr:NAD(P)/FAD-dependent oxidoreductase [Nitratireductor sp. B36]MCC5780617.1 FAD-dependent oxidoreductase [Nitratireductor sp. B36]